MKLDSQPINALLGSYYNVIHPKDLPYGKWQVPGADSFAVSEIQMIRRGSGRRQNSRSGRGREHPSNRAGADETTERALHPRGCDFLRPNAKDRE